MHKILIMHYNIFKTTFTWVCSGWIAFSNGVQNLPSAVPPGCCGSARYFEMLIVLPQWIWTLGSLVNSGWLSRFVYIARREWWCPTSIGLQSTFENRVNLRSRHRWWIDQLPDAAEMLQLQLFFSILPIRRTSAKMKLVRVHCFLLEL